MEGEKLERRERGFWESEKEIRKRESKGAGRPNMYILKNLNKQHTIDSYINNY